MIEKLKVYEETPSGYKHPENTIQDKINELVDAVNELTSCVGQLGVEFTDTTPAENVQDRMIGCTTLDIPESYKTDPYARQRKCICKLCWFWNDDKANKVIGILTGVFDEADRPFERNIDQTLYKHCEPVKPDSDIIYKGE